MLKQYALEFRLITLLVVILLMAGGCQSRHAKQSVVQSRFDSCYKEEAISQTDHNLTIYSHACVEHVSKNSHWNALHLAIPVKAYYDLCPHLSIYAKAEYKVLIFKHSEAPQGLLTASIGLQFHIRP